MFFSRGVGAVWVGVVAGIVVGEIPDVGSHIDALKIPGKKP